MKIIISYYWDRLFLREDDEDVRLRVIVRLQGLFRSERQAMFASRIALSTAATSSSDNTQPTDKKFAKEKNLR